MDVVVSREGKVIDVQALIPGEAQRDVAACMLKHPEEFHDRIARRAGTYKFTMMIHDGCDDGFAIPAEK
jgi:hypothetical protein